MRKQLGKRGTQLAHSRLYFDFAAGAFALSLYCVSRARAEKRDWTDRRLEVKLNQSEKRCDRVKGRRTGIEERKQREA